MRFFLLGMVVLFISCQFNNTYENEESEKGEAEKVTAIFYNDIKDKKFEETEKLFATAFFEITSSEDLQAILNKTSTVVGNYKSRKLIDWKTKRTVGSNPSSEYLLVYEVVYDKYPSRETFRLVKERDVIKIFAYNVNSEGFIR